MNYRFLRNIHPPPPQFRNTPLPPPTNFIKSLTLQLPKGEKAIYN